jgi:hypothetical protein
MASKDNSSPHQQRVEELKEQGHSLSHAIGAAWAEQTPGFTAPAEHGVDPPSTRRPGRGD